VFEPVPACCEEYISFAYTELGSPGLNFTSLWQVYNQLRDAVDLDFWTTTDGSVSDAENMSKEADADQLPLNHLRPYVLDENGVPAGKASSEYNDAESGMPLIPPPSQMFVRPQTHTSIQNLLWQWNSQTMKVTRSTESFSSPGMPLHLVQCFKVFVLSAYCVT
jgi:hypothetical protein